ncbi:MAG: sensor histidine kinase [Thermogutta sp.]
MDHQTIAVTWDYLWEDDVRFPNCHAHEQLQRLFPEVKVAFVASFNEKKQPIAFWCESQWSEQPEGTLKELRTYLDRGEKLGPGEWFLFDYLQSESIHAFVTRFQSPGKCCQMQQLPAGFVVGLYRGSEDAFHQARPLLIPFASVLGIAAWLADRLFFCCTKIDQLEQEKESLKSSHSQAVSMALEEHELVLLAEEKQKALQELIEAKEASYRAKNQFLANVSHELRTPLHAILSYASFGLKKIDTADKQTLFRYFQQIETSGKSLLAFFNDLLDLSKLEAGKMQYEISACDVVRITCSVLEEFRSLAEQKRINLEYQGPERFLAELDPTRFAQVVRNLVSNAVKFTPEGRHVWVNLTPQEGSFLLRVEDEGCGVPEDELDTIFESFYQSSRTKTSAGGTGLGLAICQEIVFAHGGRIWVENRSEGGARFSVIWPTRRAERELVAAGSQDSSSKQQGR